jgi:polyhydroxyalkanoate synthesis regulator phasin
MKRLDFTLLLKKLNLTEKQVDAAREKGLSIADLAKQKGISFSDYKKAELAAAKEQLASLVKSGDLTKSQAADMLKHHTERFSGVSSYADLKEQMPKGHRGDKGGFFNESLIADVLKALGLSQDTFDAANQSLAAYAKAQSIKFADYKKALLAAQTTQLDQFVKDGKMTKKQATEIKARLTEEFSDANSYDDLPDRGQHGPGGHGGHGHDVFGDTTSAILKRLNLDAMKFKAANQPLPEFAEANNISFAAFEKAVLAEQTKAIDAKVKSGAITKKQATTIKERMQERADEVSSYDDLQQGPRGHGPGRHHGMNDADRPDQADPNASETSVDLAI